MHISIRCIIDSNNLFILDDWKKNLLMVNLLLNLSFTMGRKVKSYCETIEHVIHLCACRVHPTMYIMGLSIQAGPTLHMSLSQMKVHDIVMCFNCVNVYLYL